MKLRKNISVNVKNGSTDKLIDKSTNEGLEQHGLLKKASVRKISDLIYLKILTTTDLKIFSRLVKKFLVAWSKD